MRTKLTLVLACLSISTGCGVPAQDALVGVDSAPNEAAPNTGVPPTVDRNQQGFNTETYDYIQESGFVNANHQPLSTFSIDVDTASYANVRRFLSQGQLPPPGAVRIEELLNYFSYSYAPPADDKPFAVYVNVAACPWQRDHQLVRIALKGRTIEHQQRPSSNLVFLLDVSGSMDSPQKLPLVKSTLRLLLAQLDERDRIAIVVYAGASGLVLPSTSADNTETIAAALEALQSGGSTNGGQGILLAYKIAAENFIPGGTNRVILCTDGDFNIGITSQSELVRRIKEEAQGGVFLTVLGFGQGNLKDSTMEKLADHGNGNYGYIDSALEVRKTLVEQMSGTLITIAKDVKIQVDFNPQHVSAYRLIGYENRSLRNEDFRDDSQDAGEIGADHTVTAMYEIVPTGEVSPAGHVDPSKYVTVDTRAADHGDELLTVRLRYKQPAEADSRELRVPLRQPEYFEFTADPDFGFAQSVAAFGMLLRSSQFKGDTTLDWVIANAQSNLGADVGGYRKEFVRLAQAAQSLTNDYD